MFYAIWECTKYTFIVSLYFFNIYSSDQLLHPIYLIVERSDVIFEVEGSRLLVELRVIDGGLVDVPE